MPEYWNRMHFIRHVSWNSANERKRKTQLLKRKALEINILKTDGDCTVSDRHPCRREKYLFKRKMKDKLDTWKLKENRNGGK